MAEPRITHPELRQAHNRLARLAQRMLDDSLVQLDAKADDLDRRHGITSDRTGRRIAEQLKTREQRRLESDPMYALGQAYGALVTNVAAMAERMVAGFRAGTIR